MSTGHCASIDSTSALACAIADALLHPPDEIEEVAAAAARVGGIQRQRQPDLHLRVVNVVARRHDADDPGRHAVDLDDAADDRLVAPERRLPDLGGQHGDVFGARKRVRACELAAPHRLHPEHRHQLGGDDRRIHPAWLLRRAEIHRPGPVRADVVERPLPLAELEELRGRHPELIEAEAPETGW